MPSHTGRPAFALAPNPARPAPHHCIGFFDTIRSMEHDELAQHLESLQRESCYRVDAVLKQSPVEITQRVFFQGENGAETGPYIRKFIKRGVGIGAAYERLFSAQQRGRRFKYIPDMIECYTRDDELVVVMELVRGKTLQEVVYERDPSTQLALEIFPMLCDAASELHCEFDPPIIHRDLKPSNIILTGEGLALIDFGISREYDEGADADTTHFGTREFAPPEQYGFGQTGTYSDIYSLGMVLYFCLTEEIPNAQARKQEFRNPNIPEGLRAVIAKAVALDPSMRFDSADELKRAFLAAAIESETQRQMRAEQAEAGRNRKRGGFAKLIAVAVAALACIALVMGLSLGSKATSTSQQPASSNASGISEDSSNSANRSDEATQQAEESVLPSSSSPSDSGSATVESIASDINNQAAQKNGFDPETNEIVQVAGVQFQIPHYFTASTSESGEFRYYYAERGTSVAMIMTGETPMDESVGRAEFEAQKDDYLSGIMEADGLEEVTASVDCELAGFSTRIVTIRGAIMGLPMSAKAAYFFNPDSHTVGVIVFGQTDNAQFDYAGDFAKVIASAKRA